MKLALLVVGLLGVVFGLGVVAVHRVAMTVAGMVP